MTAKIEALGLAEFSQAKATERRLTTAVLKPLSDRALAPVGGDTPREGGGEAALSPRSPREEELASFRAAFSAEDIVQLDEESVFYLPPLVVTLLSSFCRELGQRDVRNYIKHHRPLEKAEEGLEEALATRSCELMRKRTPSRGGLLPPINIRALGAAPAAAALGSGRQVFSGALSRVSGGLSSGRRRSADGKGAGGASSESGESTPSCATEEGGVSTPDDMADLVESSVFAQLDQARAAIAIVHEVEQEVARVQRYSDPGGFPEGPSSPLTREESAVLETERELAIAALQDAADRLQRGAAKAQQKLQQQRERRSSEEGAVRRSGEEGAVGGPSDKASPRSTGQ